MTTPQSTSICPSFLWWNLAFTLPEVIIAKTKKKDISDLRPPSPTKEESNYNSLRLIWRRGLRPPLFRRLSAGWGMNRSAMSLDFPASLSRPNVIREDLPKHHLVIIKVNIPYNHRKEYQKELKRKNKGEKTSKDKRSRGWGVLLNRGRIKPN